jgi:hypothetical protein
MPPKPRRQGAAAPAASTPDPAPTLADIGASVDANGDAIKTLVTSVSSLTSLVKDVSENQSAQKQELADVRQTQRQHSKLLAGLVEKRAIDQPAGSKRAALGGGLSRQPAKHAKLRNLAALAAAAKRDTLYTEWLCALFPIIDRTLCYADITAMCDLAAEASSKYHKALVEKLAKHVIQPWLINSDWTVSETHLFQGAFYILHHEPQQSIGALRPDRAPPQLHAFRLLAPRRAPD